MRLEFSARDAAGPSRVSLAAAFVAGAGAGLICSAAGGDAARVGVLRLAIVARGGLVPVGPLAMLARSSWRGSTGRDRRSLADALLTVAGGSASSAHGAQARRPGAGGQERARHAAADLPALWIAYDPRAWWQREVWDPQLDTAIPLRAHEPDGEKLLNFLRLEQDWLRAGAQWWFKVSLELERLTWSTLRAVLNALAELSAVPRRARGRGPVAARAPGRGAGADARLPRRAQEPQGKRGPRRASRCPARRSPTTWSGSRGSTGSWTTTGAGRRARLSDRAGGGSGPSTRASGATARSRASPAAR